MYVFAIGQGLHPDSHVFERGSDFPWWTVSWLAQGQTTFTRHRRSVSVTGPALIVIPPCTPYHVHAPRVHETWLFLRPPTHWLEWLELPELLPGIRARPHHDPRVADAVRDLHRSADDVLLRDNACERLLLLVRPTHQRHPLTAAALDTLESDLAYPHTLNSLARRVGGSRSRMAEVFTQDLGMPPMRWLEHRRIESACSLLLATTRAVQDIAEEVGYLNAFHFSTRFRAVVGVAPAHWRKSPGPWVGYAPKRSRRD